VQLVEVGTELVGRPNLCGDLCKRARGVGRELGQVSFTSLEARVEDQNARLSLLGQLAQLRLRRGSTVKSGAQAGLHREIERLRHRLGDYRKRHSG
jgi:hypothetical protein